MIFFELSVKELQKFVPSVTAADISRGPAGVRAQAMNSSGDLIGDFIFDSATTESPKGPQKAARQPPGSP